MINNGYMPWSILTATQQDERDVWLRHNLLPRFDPLYARLGPLRQKFMDAFHASGCREVTNQFMNDPVARFCSHLEIDGFQNENILYDRALRHGDLKNMFGTINHERKHAIQFNEVAALHANPFNPKTRLVLTPAAELQIMEAKEADAMSWAWLLEQIVDGKISAHDHAAQETALQNHARHVLETEIIHGTSTALDYYRNLALSHYESILKARRAQYGPGGLTFVGLDKNALDKFGSSIGVHSFDGPLHTPPLNSKQADRVAAMYDDYNVPHNPLPLSQELAARGQTEADFMADSRLPPAHVRPAEQEYAAKQQIQLTYA